MADNNTTKAGDNIDENQFVTPPDNQNNTPADNNPVPPQKEPETPSKDNNSPEDFSFEDFEKAMGNQIDRKPIDPTEPKKEDNLKTEVKKDETPDKKDEKQNNQPPQKDELTPGQKEEEKLRGKRDYSGLEESDIPIFKAMSRDAFDKLKPVYLKQKETEAAIAERDATIVKLKSGYIPDSYYEHERAYTLTPQFEAKANLAIQAGQLVEHYRKQLADVKAGSDTFHEVFSQDGKMFTRPIKADANTVSILEKTVENMREQHLRVNAELQQLSQDHINKVKESAKQLDEFEEKSFANFRGENATKLEPIIKDTISKVLPPAFHNNRLAVTLAKSLITIQQLGSIVKSLNEQISKHGNQPSNKDNSNKDNGKKNPTMSDISGGDSGGNKGGGDDVTIEAFEEYTGKRR